MTKPPKRETPKRRRTEGKPIEDTVEPTRVLIVDDHAILREGLVMVLGLEPDLQVVGEAATGDEAVAKATELKPGLVLMDVLMTGKDGLEATNAMKGDEEHCLEAGMDAYIAKPIDPERLFEVIREIVSA